MAFAQLKKNKAFCLFVNFVIFINNWAFIASNIILINKLAANIVSTYISDAPHFLTDPNGIFWSIFITVFLVFPSIILFLLIIKNV